jgi:hypothetical protein
MTGQICMTGSHGHGGDALVGLVTNDSRSSLEAENFAVSLASLRVKGRRAGEDCLFDCCAYASVEIADERERGRKVHWSLPEETKNPY